MKLVCVLVLACVLLTGCATICLSSAPEGSFVPGTNGSSFPDTIPSEPNTSVSTSPTAGNAPNKPLVTNPWDAEPNRNFAELSEEYHRRIREDYSQLMKYCTPDQIDLRVLGLFDDTCALFLDVRGMMYAQAITSETVAGYTFWYSCLHTMEVYHDGGFYSLQEAYDAELLSAEDLKVIFENYYGAYPNLWALYYGAEE